MADRVGGTAPKRVLILGGGFGGVTVAQELEKLRRKTRVPIEVSLVSQNNYLLFVPMLPEAAAGSLALANILTPLRSLLPDTHVRLETVQHVDLAARTARTVRTGSHEEELLPYDYLVVALGNVVNLAGMPGVAEHGLPIKTIGDALHIRNRTLDMLEAAANATDPAERQRMLTFVVVGGGFSGVELAAEVNDFVREAARAYHSLDPREVRVLLLHSGERLLPEISANLARFAQRHLEQRGVEVRLKVRLAAATAHSVVLQGGEQIASHSLMVAIGAGPNPVVQMLDAPKDRGRLQVDQYLQVRDTANVWALGDCAAAPHPITGEPVPPTAQYALREGRTVARNVMAAIHGLPPDRFRFTGLGQLVSLGHQSAVAELFGKVRLAGLLAWLMWRGFYLFRLPGLERKVRVLLDWGLDIFFPRDLVQLNVQRTERVSLAHYEPGEAIVRQGEPAEAFYVITRGEVAVLREEGGQEVELARLKRGESFGEVGLLRHQRRNATVRAVDQVDVLALGRSDFDLLAGTWSNLGTVLESTARRRDSGTFQAVKLPDPPSAP